MKLAYIILAHQAPQQMARLIRTLQQGNDDVFFVHLDSRAERRLGGDFLSACKEALGASKHVEFLRRHACCWGGFGIVAATIEGVMAVGSYGRKFDRVILLSGQDYPIKPVSQIRAFFEANAGTEFIESFRLKDQNRWTDQRGSFNATARFWHRHYKILGRDLHIPFGRRFFAGYEAYGGSQWWCLTYNCVLFICSFLSAHLSFVSYFKRCFIPDELFFQTIISNSAFASRVAGYDLTFADWTRASPPYPAIIDSSYLLALSRSAKLFARKFDANSPTVLDDIDSKLLGLNRQAELRGNDSTSFAS